MLSNNYLDGLFCYLQFVGNQKFSYICKYQELQLKNKI